LITDGDDLKAEKKTGGHEISWPPFFFA